MKKLDLSAVTPSVGIIPQKDTVEHITSSYLEGVASLAKSMIPTSWQTGKLVILHGCVATGSNPAPRTLTSGAVFYNGEVYQVPAASFNTTGLQIGIWTLQDVNTGTESKLTDGSDVHVLVDNKFVFAAGLSGSGDFDEGEEINTRVIVESNYTSMFSAIPLTGATLNDSNVQVSIEGRHLMYKLTLALTVTNAASFNSGSDLDYNFTWTLLSKYATETVLDVASVGVGYKNGVIKRGTALLFTSGTNAVFNLVIEGQNVSNSDTVIIIVSGFIPIS